MADGLKSANDALRRFGRFPQAAPSLPCDNLDHVYEGKSDSRGCASKSGVFFQPKFGAPAGLEPASTMGSFEI